MSYFLSSTLNKESQLQKQKSEKGKEIGASRGKGKSKPTQRSKEKRGKTSIQKGTSDARESGEGELYVGPSSSFSRRIAEEMPRTPGPAPFQGRSGTKHKTTIQELPSALKRKVHEKAFNFKSQKEISKSSAQFKIKEKEYEDKLDKISMMNVNLNFLDDYEEVIPLRHSLLERKPPMKIGIIWFI
jgi:hypothetical protein